MTIILMTVFAAIVAACLALGAVVGLLLGSTLVGLGAGGIFGLFVACMAWAHMARQLPTGR
jgi:hypothetical protein